MYTNCQRNVIDYYNLQKDGIQPLSETSGPDRGAAYRASSVCVYSVWCYYPELSTVHLQQYNRSSNHDSDHSLPIYTAKLTSEQQKTGNVTGNRNISRFYLLDIKNKKKVYIINNLFLIYNSLYLKNGGTVKVTFY